VDVSKEIRKAVDTGKVILGTDKSLRAIKIGQAKLVIVALNCPSGVLTDVKRYSGSANIPVHIFEGDSAKLGVACGKLFLVNVLTVLEPGVSNILSLGETR
jgi:large subunit ribosomal protein L30e